MCKLILGVQKENSKEFEKLIKAQFDVLKYEKDGCGALMIMKDGSVEVEQRLIDYDGVFNLVMRKLPDIAVLGLHTRTSTSGASDFANIHFFVEDGVYLAHNGFVTGVFDKAIEKKTAKKGEVMKLDEKHYDEYNRLIEIMAKCGDCDLTDYTACEKHAGVGIRIMKLENKEADSKLYDDYSYAGYHSSNNYSYKENRKGDCDSKKFLHCIVAGGAVTGEAIEKLAIENKFAGVCMVYDSNAKKLFLLVAKRIYSLGDDKTYNTIFSYDPEVKIGDDVVREAFGVELYEENETDLSEKRKLRGVYEGVHEIVIPFAETKGRKKNK